MIGSPWAWRFLCYLDKMHVMDCKGVASWVYGGVVATLLTDRRLGANRDARLVEINSKTAHWYDNHPGTHRLPRLCLTSVFNDEWADLSGPAIKAANTRHAAPLFEALAAEYFTTATLHDMSIRNITAMIA